MKVQELPTIEAVALARFKPFAIIIRSFTDNQKFYVYASTSPDEADIFVSDVSFEEAQAIALEFNKEVPENETKESEEIE